MNLASMSQKESYVWRNKLPKVFNKKTDRNIPKEAVYICRPSVWENPFRIRVHSLSQHNENSNMSVTNKRKV